jgi:hypothetical protein
VSQTITWAASKGTTTRVATDGSPKQGSGDCKRLYVGRYGTNNYDAFLQFTLSWTGVGKIVRAVLTLYTDDGLGILGDVVSATEHPKVVVRRLTGSFSEGTGSAVFDNDDYTNPAATTSDQVTASMARDSLGVTNIDITAMVEDWAPSTVKRRNGSPGGKATNYGIGLFGTSSTGENWAGISEDAEAIVSALKPVITLTYDFGHTVPNAPTAMTPSGSVASIGSFQGDFTDPRATDKLAYSQVQVYTSAASATGQTVTGGTKVYDRTQAESNTSIINGRFDHIPDNFHPKVNTTYKWRARVKDNEGQWSLYTALTSFSVSNTDPNAPTLAPNGSSYSSLDGILFRGGTFSDADSGDTLLAYQVQLSAYASGDPHWDDDEFIKWNTGKRYVASRATSWETPYGGDSLSAGTYYWRARQWDNHQGVSNWSYGTVILTADFIEEAQDSTNAIQMRPRARWRIVIKGMGTNRGPGTTVAVLEDAYNVGASMLYNSPGEAHWTLGIAHPQLSVIEPKRTHYSIQFRQGDGWREVFAGLVWDFDATDRDIVFYGIDYLGLLDFSIDEHYDPANAERSAANGGSKYTSKTITSIVTDQLKRAREVKNSPVGFISTGTIATMSETITVYSTYQPTLNFVVGLLDSHRAGTGKMTRLSVQRTTAGGYQYVVQDAPGVVRDNLRLRFGELVQGYRVVPFGNAWSTRVSGIGRDKDGLKVRYVTKVATGISEATWGRWNTPQFFDGVSDANDLARRVAQAAKSASKLGKQIALGLRSGVLQPRDGYDLLDQFPVEIEHGSVSTSAFGSGYWVAVGITWTAQQRGDLSTTLTLAPREDDTAPDADLLVTAPISSQAEWQVGWKSPNPLLATSRYWLDQSTGIVYTRSEGALVKEGITGTA